MFGEFGNFSLSIAFLTSLIIFFSYFIFKILGIRYSHKYVIFCSQLRSISIFIAFISLVYSYIISDFSIINVFYNSHQDKPLIYKISGSWGNHEGSMLLWLFLFEIITVIFYYFSSFEYKEKSYILQIQNIIAFLLISFVLYSSNPLIRIILTPKMGLGLNPVLQDIGLAIHPPALYLGYVTLSVIFSSSIYFLLKGSFNKEDAKNIHPWIILSFGFLSLGVGLGSWWAYRELGWGGFWFWDPVENISLIPWLLVASLVHTNLNVLKTESLKKWNIILAMLSFMSSITGTFLVRSGILTSVHSFASDPERGIFILSIIMILVFISLIIYFARIGKILESEIDIFLSRSGGIYIGNLILIILAFTVFLGTNYPIFYQIFYNKSITVGMPYFNKTFLPISAALILITILFPLTGWQGSKFNYNLVRKYLIPLFFTSFITLILNIQSQINIYANIFILLSIWLIILMLYDLYLRIRSGQKIGKGYQALFLAHVGFSFVVLSITLSNLYDFEKNIFVKKSEKISMNSFSLYVKKIELGENKNYFYQKAILNIFRNNKEIACLEPEIRFYKIEKTQTSESAIYHNLLYDFYVVATEDKVDKEAIQLRIYYKPFISWMWFGVIMIFVASMISFLRRIER